MEYRKLGQTGLMVSELCLGTMTFGNEADEQTSKRITDRFVEAGGNFVDTANVYSRGVSERSRAASSATIATTWCSRPSSASRWARGPTTPAPP
jgi:aryl-alcohol dehydrogenase-like predicted oxidoreductase